MTIFPQDFTQGTTKSRGDMQNVSSEFSVTSLGTAPYQEIFIRHKVKQKYGILSRHLHMTLLVGSNLSHKNLRKLKIQLRSSLPMNTHTLTFRWRKEMGLEGEMREKAIGCWSFPKGQ